jgi:hypothetical protein
LSPVATLGLMVKVCVLEAGVKLVVLTALVAAPPPFD